VHIVLQCHGAAHDTTGAPCRFELEPPSTASAGEARRHEGPARAHPTDDDSDSATDDASTTTRDDGSASCALRPCSLHQREDDEEDTEDRDPGKSEE